MYCTKSEAKFPISLGRTCIMSLSVCLHKAVVISLRDIWLITIHIIHSIQALSHNSQTGWRVVEAENLPVYIPLEVVWSTFQRVGVEGSSVIGVANKLAFRSQMKAVIMGSDVENGCRRVKTAKRHYGQSCPPSLTTSSRWLSMIFGGFLCRR